MPLRSASIPPPAPLPSRRGLAAFETDPDWAASGIVVARVPRPGDLVADRYRLRAEIGRGGMSFVWEAEDTAGGGVVALKFLRIDLRLDDLRERFEAEARIAARLVSPHIAAVLDHGTDGDVPFIVLERLHGEELTTRLRRLRRIPAEACVRMIRDVARGLAVAHRAGVVHRDVKVQNVFLAQGPDGAEIAKLLDFGVAKLEDVSPRTRTGTIVGSPLSMSPEQVRGERSVDARSDLFSLATLAYRCLLGVAPFRGDMTVVLESIAEGRFVPPSRVDPSVPRALDAFFARALAVAPADRFASARELADAFAIALGIRPEATDVHAMETRVMPRPTLDALTAGAGSTPTTRPPPRPGFAPPAHDAASPPRAAGASTFAKLTGWFVVPRVAAAAAPAPRSRASWLAGAALAGAIVAAVAAALS